MQYLTIHRNTLNGHLPSTLTNLNLTRFCYDETDLCEPGASTVQIWLGGISSLQRTYVICGTQTVSGSVWNDISSNGIQRHRAAHRGGMGAYACLLPVYQEVAGCARNLTQRDPNKSEQAIHQSLLSNQKGMRNETPSSSEVLLNQSHEGPLVTGVLQQYGIVI